MRSDGLEAEGNASCRSDKLFPNPPQLDSGSSSSVGGCVKASFREGRGSRDPQREDPARDLAGRRNMELRRRPGPVGGPCWTPAKHVPEP